MDIRLAIARTRWLATKPDESGSAVGQNLLISFEFHSAFEPYAGLAGFITK